MDNEQAAAEKIAQYAELAKEDKKIDATALMINALAQAQEAEIAAKKKRWAYLVSVGAPPFGLIYAIKYGLAGTREGKRTAWICVILTVVSLLLAWLIAEAFLASAGPQLQQIQSLNANELQDLLQQ